VPIGGGTTITAAEAAEVVAQVGPKIVIPMHFALDGASKDLGSPEKFMHEMATEPIRQPKAQVTHSSLPDETQVVLLEARGRTS
jgi:L-ascorbate metabolism protein UlaG (beta-lactamase superfamily)